VPVLVIAHLLIKSSQPGRFEADHRPAEIVAAPELGL
jgi:hypothetical protein